MFKEIKCPKCELMMDKWVNTERFEGFECVVCKISVNIFNEPTKQTMKALSRVIDNVLKKSS